MDDIPFDKKVSQIKHTLIWTVIPTESYETNCVHSAVEALRAGDLNVDGYELIPNLPSLLGAIQHPYSLHLELQRMSKNNAKVRVIK